jgi:hypothetical protein
MGSAGSAPSDNNLKEIVIESPHPYENNANVNEAITIPGASRLNVVFDDETNTEDGCDIVRFFSQPEGVD